MKKLILILLILFLTSVSINLFSQESEVSEAKLIERTTDSESFIGLAIGPETMFSALLPKFSLYQFKREENPVQLFYGVEGSFWIAGAFFASMDFTIGLKKSIFTLETSLGGWWFPKKGDDGHNAHITFNPKIGIKIWGIWIKAGPSFFIYQHYANNKDGIEGWLDVTKNGKMNFNIEFTIKFPPFQSNFAIY